MSALIDSRATSWNNIVLLCGKCARKLDGGYGRKGKDTLRSTLHETLKDAGHRRDVQIIETRCMGVCPKKATTMAVANRPGVIFVVPVGASTGDAMKLVMGCAEKLVIGPLTDTNRQKD